MQFRLKLRMTKTNLLILFALTIFLQLTTAEYTWNGHKWEWKESSTRFNIDDGLLDNFHDDGSGDIIDEHDDEDIESGSTEVPYLREGNRIFLILQYMYFYIPNFDSHCYQSCR